MIHLTNIVKMKYVKMNSLGDAIRKLREAKGLPLRIVSAYLDIDQAILSKIERGQRNASREHIIQLASYFKVNENELLAAWLSDKLVNEVGDEEMGLKALQLAEAALAYQIKPKLNKASLIKRIKDELEKDGRVAHAYIYGSFARGEEKPNSDIDIMVEMNTARQYSLFDLQDIAFILENAINRKVDLVEKGYLKDFALKTAAKDLIKIYG